MADRDHLRVIDGQGEIAEDVTAIPSREAELLDELVALKRQIAALKGRVTKLMKVDPRAEEIEEVLEHWRTSCHPGALVPLDGARAVKVKERLAEGSSVAELKAAIDVAATYPYMGKFGVRYCEPGEGRQLRDELTLLLRDEVHVAELIRLGRCVACEDAHRAYRAWLHAECQVKPGLVRALAHLASREPHGQVIAAAAVWARREQARADGAGAS